MWKQYIDNYYASDYGEIKNIKTGRILKQQISNKGYAKTNIIINGKIKTIFIHKVVAELFIPNPLNLPYVNHKDGNKLNNTANNLEWVTRSENDLHAFRNDLRHVHVPFNKGDVYYQVLEYSTGVLIKEYNSRQSLVEDYPMSRNTFQLSVNRGWFFKDWHNKRLGKYKIIRYFK